MRKKLFKVRPIGLTWIRVAAVTVWTVHNVIKALIGQADPWPSDNEDICEEGETPFL